MDDTARGYCAAARGGQSDSYAFPMMALAGATVGENTGLQKIVEKYRYRLDSAWFLCVEIPKTWCQQHGNSYAAPMNLTSR
jgi:hypothetical protein